MGTGHIVREMEAVVSAPHLNEEWMMCVCVCVCLCVCVCVCDVCLLSDFREEQRTASLKIVCVCVCVCVCVWVCVSMRSNPPCALTVRWGLCSDRGCDYV